MMITRRTFLTAVVALVFGIIGMGIWAIGIHLYQDHRNLHALVELVQNAQAKAPPARPPTPPADPAK